MSMWMVRIWELTIQTLLFMFLLRPLPSLLGFKQEAIFLIGADFFNAWMNIIKDTDYLTWRSYESTCSWVVQYEYLGDMIRCLGFALIQSYFSNYKLPFRISYPLIESFAEFISFPESKKLFEDFLKAKHPNQLEIFCQEYEMLKDEGNVSFMQQEEDDSSSSQLKILFETFKSSVSFKRYALLVKETYEIEFMALDGTF